MISTGKRFRAQLGYQNQRLKSQDIFDTAEEAAREYDRMALEHFGEFAELNFPDDAEAYEQVLAEMSDIERAQARRWLS